MIVGLYDSDNNFGNDYRKFYDDFDDLIMNIKPAVDVEPQPWTSESFHRLYGSPRAGRQAGHIT